MGSGADGGADEPRSEDGLDRLEELLAKLDERLAKGDDRLLARINHHLKRSEARRESSLSSSAKPRLADSTAARPIIDVAELLGDQRKSLQRILLRIRDIADNEGREEVAASGDKAYLKQLRTRRPRQVFFIDGARGAGKTSLLLTVREYLSYLGDANKWCLGDSDGLQIIRALRVFAKEALKHEHPALKDDDQLCTQHYASGIRVGSDDRRVACSLDILFPSDLEGGQPVMEGIFAFMHRKLDDEIDRLEHEKPSDWNKRVDEARKLKNKLVRKISPGWYLSRSDGSDAIIRDSADYHDYLKKMGDAGVIAFSRVHAFRDFVVDYLKFFKAELLAVFFDDTDVSPSVTRDILHTIRIFLDHPRIVTILAGHLKSMRQSLLWEYMRDIKEPIDAAAETEGTTATEWRQFQQQQVEEYLEKVLPRQFRNLIRVEHMNDLDDHATEEEDDDDDEGTDGGNTDKEREDKSDFAAIFGETFNKYCAEVQNKFLPEFAKAKHEAYYNDSISRLEIQDERQRSDLENWMAWYFFRHRYSDQLKPRSVRVKVTMKSMAMPAKESPFHSDKVPGDFRRRLAVFLFDNPDNYELIQRFGDTDTRVMRWLRRQQVRSKWTGERYFEINGNKIYEGTYSYSFISFRTDLGIGTPVRENPDDRPPLGLFGKPLGLNLIADRPFYPAMHRQRLFGVAAMLRHSLIPANCLYMWDLQCLPDILWQDESNPKSNPWGSRLIYEWPNMFVFETSDWNSGVHREKDTARAVEEGTRLKNYLINVLVPFASIDLGGFVKSTWQLMDYPDARKETHREPDAQKGDYPPRSLLREEALNRKALSKIVERADIVRRRYDYLEAIGKESLGSSSVSKASQDLIGEWGELLMDVLLPDEQARIVSAGDEQPKAWEKLDLEETEYHSVTSMLREHLRSYQWILNDLRKAHHAARVFSNDVSSTQRFVPREGPAKAGSAAFLSRNRTRQDQFAKTDRYTVITIDSLSRWVFQSNFLRDQYGSDEVAKESPALEFPEETASTAKKTLIADLIEIYGVSRPKEKSKIVFRPANLEKGVKKTSENFKSSDWPIDLPTSGPGKKTFREAAAAARLAKAYFFFILGIAPCIPSLVHVEVASHCYGRVGNWKTSAQIAAGRWQTRIVRFAKFVQNYRRVIENVKFRLDLMQLCEVARGNLREGQRDDLPSTLSEFGANLTLAPDVSFATLGAQGLMHFWRPKGKKEAGKPTESESDNELEITFAGFPDNKDGMIKLDDAFQGWVTQKQAAEKAATLLNLTLFEDAMDSLRSAYDFTANLQKDIPGK